MRPFSNLVEKLFGGLVEQIGGIWEDSLKVRRFERRVKLFEKVKRIVDDAGFEPQQVPDKVWIPLLQFASVEDDEYLQQQWANMLANAANPLDGTQEYTSFVQILQQLTPRDVKLLMEIYSSTQLVSGFTEIEIYRLYLDAGLARVKDGFAPSERTHGGETKDQGSDHTDFSITMDRLLYLRLLDSRPESHQVFQDFTKTETKYNFTALGSALVRACTVEPTTNKDLCR